MKNKIDIASIIDKINAFVNEREWEKYHTPKNLAISMSIEANELLEIFQWENPSFQEIKNDKEKLRNVSHEMADILIYLLRFIYKLDLNLEKIVIEKLRINEEKYPVEKCRGKPDKYFAYSKEKQG